jgi:hypothetical protein
LRECGAAALKSWLVLLIVYAAVLAIVFAAAFRQLMWNRSFRPALLTGLALAVPMCFLMAIGFLMNFRLLGRHCTPTVAVIAFLVTLGTASLWQQKGSWARPACTLFVGLSLLSCLSQRFASRHAKDDYRDAVRLAKAALEGGECVWWNAEPFGCEYYHLTSGRDGPGPGKAWILMNPTTGFATGAVPPDLVIVSKPDAFDAFGAVQQFLKREGYHLDQTLPAFSIFGRPDKVSVSLSTERK